MLDRIPNKLYRENLGIVEMGEKLREGRLRWFGHVRRRRSTEPVRRVEGFQIEGKRGEVGLGRHGRNRSDWTFRRYIYPKI